MARTIGETITDIHHSSVLLVGLLEALDNMDNINISTNNALTSLIEIAGQRALDLANAIEKFENELGRVVCLQETIPEKPLMQRAGELMADTPHA